MNVNDLKQRTKNLALNVIRMIESLPKTNTSLIISRQLIRSATSIGANHSAACRAKSKADFIFKIGVVEEEADETCYWLKLLYDSKIISEDQFINLHRETNELTAIFTATRKTSRINNNSTKISNPKSQIQNHKVSF